MRKSSPIVTSMSVIDLGKCYEDMMNKKLLSNMSDCKYYTTFIYELLNNIPDETYILYTMSTPINTSSNIDTTDIRAVFEDYLSWELNIPQTKENGSPKEILLQII